MNTIQDSPGEFSLAAGGRGCSGWLYGTISGIPVNSAIPLGASSKKVVSDPRWLKSF